MESNIPEQPVIIRRGRGRPRKTPKPTPEPVIEVEHAPMPEAPRYDVEELLMPNNTVDTSDIARAPPPPSMPERASPDEAEMIRVSPIDEVEALETRMSYTPPLPMPPSPSVEDAARRRAVLSKIKKYCESFDAVRAMKFDEDWSIDKLEAHLEDIRIAVGSKSSTVLVKHTYLAAVRGVEMATCAAGMKTYGLVSVLSANAEVDCALKQLAAEVGIGSVPPGHRLTIATIGAVLALDSANRKNEVLAGFKMEPVNEAINLKFGDL